jgi:hypothetical protein
MSRTAYAKVSRESQVADHVINRVGSLIEYMHRTNPIPIGEHRIDPRTARKRLDQIPDAELHDYLARHG